MNQSEEVLKEQSCCPNCNELYDKPKLVQYYACPHCLNKLEEKESSGCKYWFGYLNQKEKSETIPQGCVECERVLECMLAQYYSSPDAVAEVKKWY